MSGELHTYESVLKRIEREGAPIRVESTPDDTVTVIPGDMRCESCGGALTGASVIVVRDRVPRGWHQEHVPELPRAGIRIVEWSATQEETR